MGFTRSTTSGMESGYRLSSLLPGTYEVRMEKVGLGNRSSRSVLASRITLLIRRAYDVQSSFVA